MERGGALVSVMGSSPLHMYAQEYFNSLNSIAQRISTDIATTVTAYEDLWHTLSVKDQHQVVNETIIYPEIVLKYSLSKSDCLPEEDHDDRPNSPSWGYFEEKRRAGLSWSDEHAAPFSWMTRSQQNLSVFSDNNTNYANINGGHARPLSFSKSPQRKKALPVSDQDGFIDPPNIVLGGSSSKLASTIGFKSQGIKDRTELLTKIKNKAVVLKIQPCKPENRAMKGVGSENHAVKIPHSGMKPTKLSGSKSISKPKNPPPPPPKLKVQQSQVQDTNRNSFFKEDVSHAKYVSGCKEVVKEVPNEVTYSESFDDFHLDINTPIKGDNLPKTGFDFLDNW